MADELRSRLARELAERALVSLVAAYGETPELVLLGGLVPDLVCSNADRAHLGTTDVDIQVDLEIQGGSVNAVRLETALKECDFRPDAQRIWRWKDQSSPGMLVKIEFLADQDDIPNQEVISFEGCESLGAANLRGTGFASKDWELRTVTAEISGMLVSVELRVATLAAYLLAKVHAARGRSLPKDWYDVAYVLLQNDAGGPEEAGRQVRERFRDDLVGATATALSELAANFVDATSQGTVSYAKTMVELHRDLDYHLETNNAVAAVELFIAVLGVDI